MRIKAIEDELNEEDGGEDNPNKSLGQFKPGPINFADDLLNQGSGDEEVVIGESQKLKSEMPIVSSKPDDAKVLSKAMTMDKDGIPTLNKVSSKEKDMLYSSKGSLKAEALRRSRMKKKYGAETIAASGIGSSGKETSAAPSKKFKKRGTGGLDKESRDLIKSMETKIEELRK